MSATISGRMPLRDLRGTGDRTFTLLLGGGVAWLVVYATALAAVGDGGGLTDSPQLAPPLIAAAAAALAARRASAPWRLLWALLAASSVLSAAGQVAGLITGHAADGEVPALTATDGLLLASLAVMVPAVFVALPRVLDLRPRGWLDALDASVLLVALGFVGYDALIEPLLGRPMSADIAVGVAYSVLAIGIVTGLCITASRSRGLVPRPAAAAAAVFVVAAATAALYTWTLVLHSFAVHEWLGLGWQLAAVLVTAAAVLSLRGGGRAIRLRWSFEEMNLPIVLGGLAITQLFVTFSVLMRRQDIGAVLASAYTVSAVLLRLVLAGRARHRLGDALGAALDRQQRLERDRDIVFAQMLRAEADERARVAADLHDDTVQIMIATLVSLDRVTAGAKAGDGDRVAAAAAAARDTLSEAVERTRRLMFELRPPLLETNGLRAALEDSAAVLRRESDIGVTVAAPPARYSPALEALVFRTIQEALSNVCKHSGARSVTIDLRDDGAILHGRVADDGRGFEVGTRLNGHEQLHYGMAMMIERIRLADGDCWISSRPGAGCTVAFALPHGSAAGVG